MPARSYAPPIERFELRVSRPDPPDGCWLWVGQIHPITGYGQFQPTGRHPVQKVYAHRWSYEHFVGPIPAGLQLDHTCHTNSDCPQGVCDHRRCVNPAHLAPVTCEMNRRLAEGWRQDAEGRWWCGKGHLVRPNNRAGQNLCLDCERVFRKGYDNTPGADGMTPRQRERVARKKRRRAMIDLPASS